MAPGPGWRTGVLGQAPELRTETVVDAPPERVWEVLTDFGRWDEWNPTLFRASGPPAVGTEVRMKLRLGPISVPMRQRILSVDRPRELVWRSRQPIQSALDVVRRFRIEPLEGGRCRLVQSETTAGFLAALEVKLLGNVITRGYENLGQALAKRARDTGDGEMA